MKLMNKIIFPIIAFTTILCSCAVDPDKGSWSSTPSAFGERNQVTVISDKHIWEGAVGDSMDYYFAAPYLVLPQPEPIFDLLHFTPQDLVYEPVKRELKLYLLVANMNDEESPTTKMIRDDIGSEKLREIKETTGFGNTVGRDKWATGQLLIYMFGFGEDKLIENIQKNGSSIISRINKEELKRIEATAYIGGENKLLENEVRDKFGVNLKIPVGYIKAIYDEQDNFIWLRRDTRDANTNIFVHKIKYTNQGQLSRDTLKAIRNGLGRYVSTDAENTYMRINDEDLPMFIEQKNINEYYALEARGIWDIANDFMGGPFISYLIHNPKKNELLFIDGFMHAPGEEKRDHMQELEHIITSVTF